MRDFLIEDYKNLNDKLDITDQKMYNAVFIYVTFFGAITAFDAKYLRKGSCYSIIISVMVFFMSAFILYYSVSWNKMRRKYLGKINIIHTAILNFGSNENFDNLCFNCYPYYLEGLSSNHSCAHCFMDKSVCSKSYSCDKEKEKINKTAEEALEKNKCGMSFAVILLCAVMCALSVVNLVLKILKII